MPRGRPPWWPENEPFPPQRTWSRRYGYGYGPPPFVRWIGCFILAVGGVAFVTGGLAGALSGSGVAFHPFFAFPLIAVVGLVVLAVVSGIRRVARPMNDFIDAARRIEAGDYSAQVPEDGSEDIRSVARAFNSMSARLKTIDEQRRNFMADVTHELRTPLSVIRGQAEAISDGVYPADESHLAPILDATQTLDRLVDDLKTLVETDAGNLVLHKEPTDLALLVHETVESFRTPAEAKRIALVTPSPAPAGEGRGEGPLVLVDPARIRQVVSNLLSNAIRHTPKGGSIKATVDGSTITVTDTGEGIPPDLRDHVFDRFAKGASSTGSGLGLSIARDIVVAHGGQIEITDTPGPGTSVRVTLH